MWMWLMSLTSGGWLQKQNEWLNKPKFYRLNEFFDRIKSSRHHKATAHPMQTIVKQLAAEMCDHTVLRVSSRG